MKIIRIHGPVFILLLVTVFTVFGELTTTPLWDAADGQVLCDAHALTLDPGTMFKHLGFYFSQPLLQLAFLGEYRLFGLDLTGYVTINLILHAFNAFIVYMLVNMLFYRNNIALLAAMMFALGVGSYGRVFMRAHQLEGIVLAGLHLLVLYFFIRNDFKNEGRIRSPLFAIGLILFLLTGLTKVSSFSLIGCLVAYKAFFYKSRSGRSVVSADILVFVIVGILFYVGQARWGYKHPTVFGDSASDIKFTLLSIKNLFRYLNLMFYPIQPSPILETAPGWLVLVYHARTVIRTFLALSIISYSFFGFVFGSQAVRFFIAWTYITLLPFTGHTATGQWLNLSHLYLASLGFCVILAAGAKGTSRLLSSRKWTRFVPYAVPVVFVIMSIGVSQKLDSQNKATAASPGAEEMRQATYLCCMDISAAR